MGITARSLVAHYQAIHDERMQGLPIVNPRLGVEAVGFRAFDAHQLGILITPWFMNLVLLPGDGEAVDIDQGATVEWALPSGSYEFTACRDEALGVYFTAIMFRTVGDFPDQQTARAVASEIMARLFARDDGAAPAAGRRVISRRALLSGQAVS